MPNYSVSKALLGVVNSQNTEFDDKFLRSADVTQEIQTFLNKSPIQLNCDKPIFGDDTSSILKQKALGLSIQNDEVLKLFIQLLNGEDNTNTNFYFRRGDGWIIKDDSSKILKHSIKADEILILSKNQFYQSASSADEAEQIAASIVTMLGGSSAQAAAAGKLAKSASGAAGKLGDIGQDVWSKIKGITEASIEYDGGHERGENTAAFQRCLIRFAGGNLVAERNNLRAPEYILNPNAKGYAAFASKTGPVVGIRHDNKSKNYADDGRFGPETLNAATKLLPIMKPLLQGSGIVIGDPKVIPASIILSDACKGLTDKEPIGTEAEDFKAMKEGKYQPPSAPTPSPAPVPAPAPAPSPSGGQVDKIDLQKDIFNTPEYKAVEKANDNATGLAANRINPKFDELNTKLKQFSELYNNKQMTKDQLISELEKAKNEAENTSTLGSSDGENFKKSVITFLNSLKNKMSILQESKRKKKKVLESKVYKEYGFLSNKNQRLHSVLMEQLKKDIRRG